MTTDPLVLNDAQKVWRYMSFSRFVWLLQNKQLWLSRVDRLDDSWEMALAGEQLKHVVARHPRPTIPLPDIQPESALDRSKRIETLWRQTTFVSCWSASDHESHALWRIYCGLTEGVAIQTTVGRLRKSVGNLSLYPVIYGAPGSIRRTPNKIDLITSKRPMFEYEHEVRIVRLTEADASDSLLGYRLDWNPETNMELIRVHPEADSSFMQTVSATVGHYAPALKTYIAWSAMKERRPLDPATTGGS